MNLRDRAIGQYREDLNAAYRGRRNWVVQVALRLGGGWRLFLARGGVQAIGDCREAVSGRHTARFGGPETFGSSRPRIDWIAAQSTAPTELGSPPERRGSVNWLL